MTQAETAFTIDPAGLRRRYPGLMRGNYFTRAAVALVLAGAFGLFIYALIRFDFSLGRIAGGISRLLGFIALMFPPDPGTQLNAFLKGMGETLAMAFLGTLLAAVFAFPVALSAARNVLPSWIARFFVRRGMDTMRSVDTLIWALMWINVVGLGPFAGILAIATTDFGALAKLFSETVENADPRPGEGVISAGGGRLSRIRFGLLPEILPVIASQILYFIESNTRSATMAGIVGAGGIGLYINESIRTQDWDKTSFIIILILIAVAIIDFVSGRIRRLISGSRAAPV